VGGGGTRKKWGGTSKNFRPAPSAGIVPPHLQIASDACTDDKYIKADCYNAEYGSYVTVLLAAVTSSHDRRRISPFARRGVDNQFRLSTMTHYLVANALWTRAPLIGSRSAAGTVITQLIKRFHCFPYLDLEWPLNRHSPSLTRTDYQCPLTTDSAVPYAKYAYSVSAEPMETPRGVPRIIHWGQYWKAENRGRRPTGRGMVRRFDAPSLSAYSPCPSPRAMGFGRALRAPPAGFGTEPRPPKRFPLFPALRMACPDTNILLFVGYHAAIGGKTHVLHS